MSVWVYMPTLGDTFESYGIDEGKNLPDENVKNWKWIEEGKIWCRLGESNRELPCCEFLYSDLGFGDEE